MGLLDPPLYLASIVQRELGELSRQRPGAFRGSGSAISGAALILRAICSDLLGPGSAHLVDDLRWEMIGLGLWRLNCEQVAQVAAAATRLCEALCELPPSSVDDAWRSWAMPRRASKDALAQPTGPQQLADASFPSFPAGSQQMAVPLSDECSEHERPAGSEGFDDRVLRVAEIVYDRGAEGVYDGLGQTEGTRVGTADGGVVYDGGLARTGNRSI